ncbi:retrovirus-related pol polyprotein from transposon TNT 1-94 [Tanacetum coccineum]
MHMLTKPQVSYDNIHKQALGYQNPFCLKRAQQIKPTLYDGNVLSKTHNVIPVVDEEETLILAEESRLKIIEKQNDPITKKEKINITLINYSVLNKLPKDFGKRFVPQQEVSIKQMFWLQSSNKNSEESSTSNTPVKIEVPSELSKLQAKDTVISKLKEIIHSLRDNVNPARVKQDIDEIETINIELEHSVAKLLSENERLHKEKKLLKKTYKEHYDSIKPTRVHAKENIKNELRKLKGKNLINTAVSKPNATSIALGMFKIDLEPLAPKVLKNKDAHIYYIKNSRECADTLREIVKNDKALSPLDSNLDSACYGDYQIGNVTYSRVYYVEGVGHNLFSVDQFCDSDLEVAFRKHTYFVRNIEGVDLLTGSRGTNLYTLSTGDMMKSSPIYLLSKASKTKCCLWHRCLSHLNFGTINQLAKQGLVRGIPKLKFEKDHLCSACSLGKSKKHSHKPKSEDTNQEIFYLLHMDLCGPMCVESINGKKYILVIVDDYSRFTWVKFLRSKDEALKFIIKFLKMIQVHLNATIRNIHIDNGTEFVNKTLLLVPQPPSPSTFVPLTRIDWDTLFQPLFDEYFNPLPCVNHPVPEVVAPEPAVSTGTPSSTSVDQDAALLSTSQTPHESPSLVFPPNIEEADHDIEVDIKHKKSGSIPINRGLIQAILTSLPPQPIGEATKASNLQKNSTWSPREITLYLLFVFNHMEDDVDISALAIEQYIALIPDDIKLGIVNPKIGDDVEFEINANFMRELRRKLFACTDDEDTYEHVRTVL